MTVLRRSKASGSLLIVTLWLVAILSVLAVAVARYLSLDLRLTAYRQAKEQARALARSGVSLAIQRLAKDGQASDSEPYDWLGDEWAWFPSEEDDPSSWVISLSSAEGDEAVSKGSVRIRIADEERKLPLNTISKQTLVELIADEAAAQAIVDARDEPDPAEDHPEGDQPYFAKNGLFVVIEELTDLPGMTGEMFARLREATSPYVSSGAPVNVNTATEDVLRAMGLSEGAIQAVAQFREGGDGPGDHADDGIFTEGGLSILQTLKDHEGVDLTGTPDGNLLSATLFGVSSQTFTIVSEGLVEHPVARVRVEAVVKRAGCGEGEPSPCVVSWRES
jgi:type II secretory pathway component PulK